MEAGEGLSFDVLAFHGAKTIRIQTKSTQTTRSGRYSFITSKGRYANKYTHSVSLTQYTRDEVDMLACAALPLEKILFVPVTTISGDRVSFSPKDFEAEGAPHDSFVAAMKVLKIV